MRQLTKETKQLLGELNSLPEISNQSANRITQTRKYKLITPLFGGGVKARENDTSKLIRETSIRGQLRFWWRATRGTGTIADMKNREDEIFGSADERVGQSKISITVTEINIGKETDLFKLGKTKSGNRKVDPADGWRDVAYAAFSLQPTSEELKAHEAPNLLKVRKGVGFTIKITYPKNEESELQAALWAWETFGGIGGRTRRGFGALDLTEVTDEEGNTIPLQKYTQDGIEEQIKADISKYCISASSSIFPTLSNASFKIKKQDDETKAWGYAVKKLRDFRQVRDMGGGHPGRNKWTEPDQLRREFMKRFPCKLTSHTPISSIDKFPRGEFGLPIVFHFQRDEGIDKDFTLTGKVSNKIERLASPLILRPVKCGEKAVSLALILDTPRIPNGGWDLVYGKNGSIVTAKTDRLDKTEVTGLTGLKNELNGKTDVLEAFLEYFAT